MRFQEGDIELIIPEHWNDAPWEAKGFFYGAELRTQGARYTLNFYDPVRLQQDISSNLETYGYFYENIIVIPGITAENMWTAARAIVRAGNLASLDRL